ncbi:hypothetical protein [Dactylosporangium sp. NPDC051541]|uniref:hypothetical protein n=1 Tax=Dactylosporangium sp. NPDC051541 TaxID=3363977 RepID=UPI0037B7089F
MQDLEKRIQDLNAALDRSMLCVEVAVVVIPLIRTLVPDYRDRVCVVEDIVDRWLGLTLVDRRQYCIGGELRPNALAEFAGDYCDEVQQGVVSDAGCCDRDYSPIEEEVVLCLHWSARVRKLWKCRNV